MEISNKKRLFWLIIIFLILVFGFLSIYWLNSSKDLKPIYSTDTTKSMKLLVPSDFPFPNNDKIAPQEFQRSMSGLLEYTRIWVSSKTVEENQKMFEDYLKNNGWNPSVRQMGTEITTISGEKDDVALNISLWKKVSNPNIEVQVHFSQK